MQSPEIENETMVRDAEEFFKLIFAASMLNQRVLKESMHRLADIASGRGKTIFKMFLAEIISFLGHIIDRELDYVLEIIQEGVEKLIKDFLHGA
jgi:hypothetical protein